MNNGITNVNVSSHYVYRLLTNSLKTNNNPWFSYESKQNRDIKIMIKNIYQSYQPVKTPHDLNDQSIQALNAAPKLKCKTKEPLDFLLVHFIEIHALTIYTTLRQFAEQLLLLNKLEATA
jgi:hypothetical protein